MTPIPVAVVGGDSSVRDRVTIYLRSCGSFECVGALATGEAGITHVVDHGPRVVVLHGHLPDITAAECVRRICAVAPACRILMLAGRGEEALALEWLRAGAGGCLPKEATREQLLMAVQDLVQGGAPLSSSVARILVDHLQTDSAAETTEAGLDRLSEREQEVLAELARGFGYKEIGANLGISLSTVRAHLHAVYDKLEVRTRQEATSTFLRCSAPSLPQALSV